MTIAPDIERVRLADACRAYHSPYHSANPAAHPEVGDLVRRKPGISTSQDLASNGLYVVMDVDRTTAPISSEDMYLHGMRYDVYLGCYDEDGDFGFAWMDSRRFELVERN